MKKIVAFGASSSKSSINNTLASFALSKVQDSVPIVLDLNDFEMPIYSIDREKKDGIPELAYRFKDSLKKADGIIISFAEHNGAYTVAFKNIAIPIITTLEKSIGYLYLVRQYFSIFYL